MSEIKPVTANQMFLAKMAGMDVQTPKPVTADQMFMQQIIEQGGGNGGASSWNDLKDKPFGEEQAFEPIVWDGNTEGLESFVSVNDVPYYRIGGYVSADLVKELIVRGIMDGQLLEMDVTGDIQRFENGWNAVGFVVGSNGQLDLGTDVFPKGLWCSDLSVVGAENGSITINPSTTLKPLDEKYMPILTSPSGKKFKLSVDDSGTISATEV